MTFARVHLECEFRRIISLTSHSACGLWRASWPHIHTLRLSGLRLGEALAIEGTMTVVVMRDGKPTEIPDAYGPLSAAKR